MKSLMRLDPFRMIGRRDPFAELWSMQREMERLFDHFLGGDTTAPAEYALWTPAVNSYTKDGHLVYKCELPGVDAKDLDVSVHDGWLTIKGERKADKEEKDKEYTYREFSYGSFERRFELPSGAKVDDLKAKFADGILEITVPVPEMKKAKKIEIETTKDVKQIGEVKKAA